jgi:general secretion pathway protein D
LTIIINKLYDLGFLNSYIKSHKTINIFFQRYENIQKYYEDVSPEKKSVIFAINNTCFFKGNIKFVNKIKNLIRYIDIKQLSKKKIKTYKICNGNPKTIVGILNVFLSKKFLINKKRSLILSVHEENNIIIAYASTNTLKIIEFLIKKIDCPQNQIHIKASILDVSITSSLENCWELLKKFSYDNLGSKGLSMFITNCRGQQLAKNLKTYKKKYPSVKLDNKKSLSKTFSNMLGNIGLQIPYFKLSNNLVLYDINSAIKSNETYSDIKIIASPSLTTINHKKAEISVGERVPMISTLANQTSQSDQNNIIPHVKYEDIILKFSVQPHIKKNNMIYIDIEQENNEIGENIPIYNNFTQSAIKTKKIKTSVCILNNQTLIIGGLINEKIIKTEKRIPILSDLPVLGHLFQDNNTIKRKSNLILMITPTIITDKEFSKRNLILNKIAKH